MNMNEVNGAALFRLVGVMAVCVAAMWILQILGFGNAGASVSKLSWVLGAASVAGAGVGLIVVSTKLSFSHVNA